MSQRLLVELIPLFLALVAGWFVPAFPAGWWATPSRILQYLAGSRRLAVVSAAAITLLLCAALSWVRPPRPAVHDEFSYLLAADTFAHGRLTNPTPALWEHFESYNILYQPTYQSKYPPGQSLFLAAGQILTGQPIVGVWLSMAAASASLCWMLLAWLPPRWALFGALLPAMRFGTLPLWEENFFAYWSTTFWGGAVALMGSALLFGALPRLMRKPAARHGLILAAGLVILANSRPYEGLVATVPAAAIVIGSAAMHWPRWRKAAPTVVLTFCGVMACSVLAMGYYNYRITGKASKSPYLLHVEQYQVAPMFVFEARLPDKTYRHDSFHEYYYDYQLGAYIRRIESLAPSRDELFGNAYFFWGYVLLPPMLWLVVRPRDPWVLFALVVVGISLVGHVVTTAPNLLPHYLAPTVPWLVFLAVVALRKMRAWHPGGRRVGRALAETAMVVCALSLPLSCARRIQSPPELRSVEQYRLQILHRLDSTAGKHLVLVHYGPEHPFYDEWVFNAANLDTAPVLWAHEMGPKENKPLLDFYSERRIWSLYVNAGPPQLEPYELHAIGQEPRNGSTQVHAESLEELSTRAPER